MKKTLILSIALIASAPAFAAGQIEDGGDGARFTGMTSGDAGTAAFAMAHFAGAEHGDGAERAGVVISTKDAGTAGFAKAQLDNGERGDN